MKHEKKIWRISYSVSGFYMLTPNGDVTGPALDLKPRDLANQAWNVGADEVVHDYDCSRIDENGLYRKL